MTIDPGTDSGPKGLVADISAHNAKLRDDLADALEKLTRARAGWGVACIENRRLNAENISLTLELAKARNCGVNPHTLPIRDLIASSELTLLYQDH